jgi:hypothetical protein
MSDSTVCTAKSSARAFDSVRPTAMICGSGEDRLRGADVVSDMAKRWLVVGQTLGASGDRVAAQPGLVLAHVSQEIASVDIADGIRAMLLAAGALTPP